jgi:hypothetical protein
MGARFVDAAADTLLATVCYTSCTACITATDKADKATNVSLAPNPSTANVRLTFSESDNTLKNITLTDALGKVVRIYSNVITSLDIAKAELPAGVYFLQIYTANGTLLTTKKVVFAA